MDLTTALAEAEKAYHLLMTGRSAAEVRDHNGELIRFTQVNATQLKKYILDLKSQLGLPLGAGPIVPVFGA